MSFLIHGLTIYQLLPERTRLRDADNGYVLRGFCEGWQASLDDLYSLIQVLEKSQDIDLTPENLLQLIAASLAWELESPELPGKRIETREITSIYDLKGTPLGTRIFSQLYMGRYYKQFFETYNYDLDQNELLKALLKGFGFKPEVWPAYGFTKIDSYVVEFIVTPKNYVPGSVRSMALKLYRKLDGFMHRASTWGYLYIHTQGGDANFPALVQNELLSISSQTQTAFRLDDPGLALDSGLTLDGTDITTVAGTAIHPSLSMLTREADLIHLDSELFLDQDDVLDQALSTSELHVVLEIR